MDVSHLEVVQFASGIAAAQNMPDKYDEYFTYSLSRNKRIVRDIFESVQETQKKILEEYNDEMKKLSEKFCDRKDGKPVSENGQYIFTENAVAFTEEKKLLDEKYKDALDKNKAFMAIKVNVEIYIHKHFFPVLHGDVADLLYLMREEPKEIK